MKNGKRILKVVVKRMVDYNPDTSWLGEYSNKVKSAYTIDRNHDSDCPRFWANDDVPDDARECDCSPVGSRELDYFEPPHENYKGEPEVEIRRYCLQDYNRMESLNRGEWCFMGIGAEAEIQSGSDVVQRIRSGGLFGIESDMAANDIQAVEKDQLSELRQELRSIGFSTRAISKAFENVQHAES